MPLFSDLLQRMPVLKETRMSTSGLALWVCWQGDLSPALPQTLQDYGGMCVGTDRDQSLWFFFSTDLFLALARLDVWAKFNRLSVAMQVLPGKLVLGTRKEIGLVLDASLTSQQLHAPQDFQVWVHPKAREQGLGMPGLTFEKVPPLSGMTMAEWASFKADPRLPYQSSLGWYAVLRPLGNPLDKGFMLGWREFFAEIETVLQRHKFKYTIHEIYLMFPIENLRALRFWVRDLLAHIRQVKDERPEKYWPCVSVVVDRRGFNLNNELPRKIAIDWEQLVPDFPHLSYRNAYLLGEGYVIHDVRFSLDNTSMEYWCNVGLDDEYTAEASLPVQVSPRLYAGSGGGCFYCGLRSHETTACPSRSMLSLDPTVWRLFSMMDIPAINQGFATLEGALAGGVADALPGLLKDETPAGILVRSLFEIGAPLQFRMIPRMWLARGKDYPRGLDEMAPKDENPVWGTLDAIAQPEHGPLEKELQGIIIRNPRDFRSRTMLGFLANEKGDVQRALQMWKEAETLSTSPLVQSWHAYLQARVHEMQGRFQNASQLYRQVARICPQWIDPEYRQVVCQVKMGFADQALGQFVTLIGKDPHIFNRVLVDPELERGQLQIFAALQPIWVEAERRTDDERVRLDKLLNDVAVWFPEEHPFTAYAAERIAMLQRFAGVKNYVAFHMVINGRMSVEKDLQLRVNQEGRDLKGRFKGYMARLVTIRDEAAWFPFPRILVDFNKDFNLCAASLNWALKTNFQEGETFKQAQTLAETEGERLQKLEGKLRFLRVVRDSTLFVLIMGRTFLWLEVLGLLLSLVAMPLALYYGERAGATWATGLLSAQKWQVQKVLVLGLSVLAIGFSALRTAVVFEKKRDKLFQEAREKEAKGD